MQIKSILCYGVILLFPLLLLSAPQDATKGGIEMVQTPALDAIPASALVVVQVKGIEGTLASLNEFVKNAVVAHQQQLVGAGEIVLQAEKTLGGVVGFEVANGVSVGIFFP